MTNDPIFTKTLVVAIPSCALVPVAGLLVGVVMAFILILAVID